MYRLPSPGLWAGKICVLPFVYNEFHRTELKKLVAFFMTSGFDTQLENLPPFGYKGEQNL